MTLDPRGPGIVGSHWIEPSAEGPERRSRSRIPRDRSAPCPHPVGDQYSVGHDCRPEGQCALCCLTCRAAVRAAEGAIFSFGYQGSTPAELLAICARLRISHVIDCRRKPMSRIPGFSGKALREMFEALPGAEGVDPPRYEQRGDKLGGVPASADWPADGKPPPCDPAALRELAAEAAAGARLLLICMEHAPGDCHRHMTIALPLAAMGVTVRHVFDGEIVEAAELQRSIDAGEDDEYECTRLEDET